MKKIIITLVSIFLFTKVEAAELVRCIDGDTAAFIYEGREEMVRFLAIDTPEYTNTKEEFGKEASEYTCNALIEAKNIELVLDPGSDKYDKYDRLLAWVFVDDKLLQKSIIESGLGEVKYIYGDYLYTDDLKAAEVVAKRNNIGIWGEYEADYTYLIPALMIILLLLIIFKGDIKKTSKFLKTIFRYKIN